MSILLTSDTKCDLVDAFKILHPKITVNQENSLINLVGEVSKFQAKKIFDEAHKIGLFDIDGEGYIYNCPSLTTSEFWSELQKEIEGK